MLPLISAARSPRTPRVNESSSKNPTSASVSFLPFLTPRSEATTPFQKTAGDLDLDFENVGDLDDESLFKLAAAAKAENEQQRALEDRALAAAMEDDVVDLRKLASETSIDTFLHKLSLVSSIGEVIQLKNDLADRHDALESKITMMNEYYESQVHGKKIGGLGKTKKLDTLRAELETLSFKEDAVASQLSKVESKNATRRATNARVLDASFNNSVDPLLTQQQERAQKAAEWFDPVLECPLKTKQITPRIKNELVIPWLLRVASMKSDRVERSDALAQWMFHEFLDSYTIAELMRLTPEGGLVLTAKRVLLALHPTLITPIPPVLTTKSDIIAERVVPDLTRVLLLAIAAGNMSDVALILSSDSCNLDQALCDTEIRAILLYAVVCCGQVDSLRHLLRRGLVHSHLLHAILFICPNIPALQVERSVSVKTAAHLAQHQLEMALGVIHGAKRQRGEVTNTNTDPSSQRGVSIVMAPDDWDEDPVNVDALLDEWETTKAYVTPAGGYSSVLFERTPEVESRRRWSSKSQSCIPFTQLLESGRLKAVRPTLRSIGVPYFDTDCVRRFGDKAYGSQTSAFHVAIRGDVPVILRSTAAIAERVVDSVLEQKRSPKSPMRQSSAAPATSQQFYYYEAHVSLDAVTSGEDAVHVGWCSEKFAADGVTPALLGNDEHSLGISLVAFDTVDTTLHCSAVMNSRASVVRGDVSALSMRTRSRAEGFATRFSISGNAVAVAVKHFNGHSQRQFANMSHTVQISMREQCSSRQHDRSDGSFTSRGGSPTSQSSSDTSAGHANNKAAEFCGDATVCDYFVAFGEASTTDAENHGRALPRDMYNVEQFEHSTVGGTASPSPLSADLSQSAAPQHENVCSNAEAIDGDIVVIGCLLDVVNNQTTFFVNGTSLGVSFDTLPDADLLYPCMSIVKFHDTGSKVSPMCRFAFDHNELRFFPSLPSNDAVDLPQDCSSPAQRQLKLFNAEAKLSFIVWLLHLEESQRATDVQFLVGGRGVDTLFIPQINESMCDLFPVGASVLNQSCEDQRMHLKPIAIINETVDLGAQHQDLDAASLCCISNPTPLLFALLQRRRDVALTLASSPLVDVSICDNFGASPLFVAAALGYDEIVGVILQRGDGETTHLLRLFSGYSPLHTAIMGEHETTVGIILHYAQQVLSESDLSSMINTPTPRGNTALHLASKMKLLNTVRLLIAAGANATILDKRQNATPLLIACSSDMPELAEVLLLSGQYHGHPSINAPAKDSGGVALCFAAQNGMESLMKIFAEAGADPDLALVDATPLICAVVMGFENTAIALVDAYLSVESGKHHLQTPALDSQAAGDGSVEKLGSPAGRIVSPFSRRFDVHAVDPKSQSTALHLACETNMINLVKKLLNCGALICSTNKQFATPLHVAIHNEHDELAIFLLQRGKEMIQDGSSAFDISLMDARGDTVLHVACRAGMVKVLEKILAMFTHQEMLFLATRTKNPRIKPFDLLAENRLGDSPLLVAIKSGHANVAEMLIAAADPSTNIAAVLDHSGSSKALIAAVDRGYFKLARLLLQRGAVATNDLRAFVHQQWEVEMAAQDSTRNSTKTTHPKFGTSINRSSIVVTTNDPSPRTTTRKSSLLIVDEFSQEYPFSSDAPSTRASAGRGSSTRFDGGGSLRKVKSTSQLVAARLSETQKSVAKSSMRRRSTIQKLFRPVGARFDDTVAAALLRLFHVDELIYEFECIMGFGTLSAPEVLEHGELIVVCLMSHSKICFSTNEAHVIAKAGYAFLQSRATTQSMLQRKEISKQQHTLCEKIFRVIRYYGKGQGPLAVDELQKILDVHRAFVMKDSSPHASPSDAPRRLIAVNESDLTNPFSGVTALQLAASLGQEDVVRFLCSNVTLNGMHRGRLSHRDTVWNSSISLLLPTRIAIIHNHPDVLAVLLEVGRCDPNGMEPIQVWPSRDTQLHTAARIPSPAMVEILLDSGAKAFGSPNSEGDDVWQFVVRQSGDVLETLLRMEIAPNPEFLLEPIAQSMHCAEDGGEHGSGCSIPPDSGVDGFVMSFLGGEANEQSRNVEYFRRWFNAPFLDPDIFDHSPFRADDCDDARFETNPDLDNGSPDVTPVEQELGLPTDVGRSPRSHGCLRSYSDAYYSSLMFACVRHQPHLVLSLMQRIPLNINVTHPATDDTVLMYVISEAMTTVGENTKRESMIALAMAMIRNFKVELNLCVLRADGESALSLAARTGDLDLIQLLLECGAPLLALKNQQHLKQQATTTFASSVNWGSVVRQKVVIWKLLAQLQYPLEHDGVVSIIAKMLEPTPATRRAFVAAVMPNLHPLGLLRLMCTSPSDVVSACTSASLGLQQDATLSLWLSVMYVTCFLPDNLKSDYYLPKKLLDTALLQLISTMPPVIHLTLHLLKLRQKAVREQQAMLQQLLQMLQPAAVMIPTTTLPSVQSGRATERQSIVRRSSSRMSITEATPRSGCSGAPRMSITGSDFGAPRPPTESPALNGLLQVPSSRSRRVSLVDSESQAELQHEPSAGDLPIMKSPFESGRFAFSPPTGSPESRPLSQDNNSSPVLQPTPSMKLLNHSSEAAQPSPLNLVTTPANLKLNVALNMIPLGIEPPRPQKGVSLEVLHFKAMDAWSSAIREYQSSSGSSFSGAQDISAAASTSVMASTVGSVQLNGASSSQSPGWNQDPATSVAPTPLDRISDILEICLRFGKNDVWGHYTDIIPVAIKISTIAKERSFLAICALCSNVTILSSLMHLRGDVMFVDEIVGESGVPVNMQKSMFMAGSSSVAASASNRDALMSPFKKQRRRFDEDGAGPRKSICPVATHFRFSVSGDTSSRRLGLMHLSRRLTYDPTAAVKTGASKAVPQSADAVSQLPGSIGAVKTKKMNSSGTHLDLSGQDDTPSSTPNFFYCLFDWAVFRHNYFGLKSPSTPTNDMLMFLMNRRCPPTYQLLQMMLARELWPTMSSDEKNSRLRATASFSRLVSGWKTSTKQDVGINMLSEAHQDSWLHLLVMHNQVVLADYFLSAAKGIFGHNTRRNATGLIPADYCSSYQMLMVLQTHHCVDLGFNATSESHRPASPNSCGRASRAATQQQVQLLVVSKGFLKVLDNDNAGIDRRMHVPAPPPKSLFGMDDSTSMLLSEELERQEALSILSPKAAGAKRNASGWSTGSLQSQSCSIGTSAPRPPIRISDETLLRNQRVAQRYLHEVFLPLVLFEASSTQDNLRLRKQGDATSPTNALSDGSVGSKGGTDQFNVSGYTEQPQPQQQQPAANFSNRKNVLIPTDLKPISLQLVTQPVQGGEPQQESSSPMASSGKWKGMSSPPSPPQQQQHRRHGSHANKMKTYIELVDTLQRHMCFTFVDDVSNKSGVRLSQDLSDSTKSSCRALFIATPMLQQALRCNLIRVQNHRVAAYDQLDAAVQCAAQPLQRTAQLKALRDLFVEVAGASQATLALEIAPDYC